MFSPVYKITTSTLTLIYNPPTLFRFHQFYTHPFVYVCTRVVYTLISESGFPAYQAVVQ